MSKQHLTQREVDAIMSRMLNAIIGALAACVLVAAMGASQESDEADAKKLREQVQQVAQKWACFPLLMWRRLHRASLIAWRV